MTYTIDFLKDNNLIIMEAKMGSHAYGTNLPTSDIDIRGVFIQPLNDILKYGYIDQITDKTNDVVFYELKRFLDLVKGNNPNILELLNIPKDCIIYKHDLYDILIENANNFITKKCRWTFAGYAIDQIKKASSYEKMINWEESQMKRMSVLDFCYVLNNMQSIEFKKWLYNINHLGEQTAHLSQFDIGLANIDHAHNLYAMYYSIGHHWGVVSDENKSNDVQLISIPKNSMPAGYLYFNKDAYSIHCKKYSEYQSWLINRNEDRFKMNKDHGKNYDSKNMSHCIRLLDMAIEIGECKGIIVRRPEEHRNLLLSIRHGEMEFEDLMELAENKIQILDRIFENSNLPESIDSEIVSSIGLEIRNKFYNL